MDIARGGSWGMGVAEYGDCGAWGLRSMGVGVLRSCKVWELQSVGVLVCNDGIVCGLQYIVVLCGSCNVNRFSIHPKLIPSRTLEYSGWS